MRYYNSDGEILYSADANVNNKALISQWDYDFESRERGEFRIVVLGGEQTASSTSDFSWPDELQKILNADEQLIKALGGPIKVFNLGWPDYGPAHHVEAFKKFKGEVQANLVVLNFVETDFWRFAQGRPATYRGKPLAQKQVFLNEAVGYDKKIYTYMIGTDGFSGLADPKTAFNAFGIFAPMEFADDPEQVRKLQGYLLREFIKGSDPDHYWFWRDLLDRGSWDPMALRMMDPMPNQELDQKRVVTFMRDSFRDIVEMHPEVIFLHNTNSFQIESKATWPLTGMLMVKDPGLKIIDTRPYVLGNMPKDRPLVELNHCPTMCEKWSNLGHAVYAEAVADIVRERLAEIGRVSNTIANVEKVGKFRIKKPKAPIIQNSEKIRFGTYLYSRGLGKTDVIRLSDELASGRYYFELKTENGLIARDPIGDTGTIGIGVGSTPTARPLGQTRDSWSLTLDGRVFAEGQQLKTVPYSANTNETLMVAIDAGAHKVWLGADGKWFGGLVPGGETAQIEYANRAIFVGLSSTHGPAGTLILKPILAEKDLNYPVPESFTVLP